MTAEELIHAVLKDLAGGRIFPDVAPENTDLPYITYQAAGGPATNLLSADTPEKSQVRMQMNVWAATRLEASTLGAQVEAAIRAASDLQPEVLGGRVATYDEITKSRGTLQEFYIFC